MDGLLRIHDTANVAFQQRRYHMAEKNSKFACASNHRYLRKENVRMRTQAVLLVFIFFAVSFSAQAQITPGRPVDNTDDDQPQNPAQTIQLPPQLQQFSGSGSVDQLVPGVIKLSVLAAIDRRLKHNPRLLLSQAPTASA